MSRPDSHRTAFVGAAWFVALLTVCVVGLEPSLLRPAKPPTTENESGSRRSFRRPRIIDRPDIAALRNTPPENPPIGADEPERRDVQPLLTAKPSPAGAPDPLHADPTAASRSGPALPSPDITPTKPSAAEISTLRGLEVPAPLTVDVIAPVSAIEGEAAPFVVRVRNSSAVDAEGVVVTVSFDESWELPGSEDLSVELHVGVVTAGAVRESSVALLPMRSGRLSANFVVASSTHPQQLLAAGVEVDPRVVELTMAGPRRRSPGQRAEFLVTVRNTTDGDLPDARVDVEYDPAILAVREASTGSVAGPGRVAWPLGTLFRGERVQIQIECDCRAEVLRSDVSVAFLSAGRTLRACSAAVEVVPAAPIDVSILDADDPWTVGDEAKFAVRIRNRTHSPVADVAVRLSMSPHFQQLTMQSPADPVLAKIVGDSYGADIRLTNLPADAEVILHGAARCVMPGDGAFRVLVQSPALAAPFETEETAIINPPPAAE
jgi:hypothetical protein